MVNIKVKQFCNLALLRPGVGTPSWVLKQISGGSGFGLQFSAMQYIKTARLHTGHFLLSLPYT